MYGDGKRLFEGVRMQALEVLGVRFTPIVTHVRFGVKRG